MVIIHIANLNTEVIGGVQTVVPEIIKAQSDKENVSLINTHGDKIDGVFMPGCSGTVDFTRLTDPYNKPDLVVFHEVYRIEFIRIYRSLNKLNIPYIIVPHGCLSQKAQHKKWVKKIAANILLFNSFLKSAQSIQYLSENEQKMSVFPQLSSFVIGTGIKIPATVKTPSSNGFIKFLYIGRLEIHIKGLDLLLKAVKKSAPFLRDKKAVFEICGPDDNGAHADIAKLIAELGIVDLVTLSGKQLGNEKISKIMSADCFIQTSRTEGLPLGPIEAMGYGLPCIVTNGVGLGELVEAYNAGYKCDTTVDGISQVLEKCISNKDQWATMSQSARCLVRENFDIDYLAEKTLLKYKEIVQ